MTRMAQLTVEDREGLILVGIEGEIDLSNARDIAVQIIDATPNSAKGLVVDLSALTYVDSAGLNSLFNLGQRSQSRRQHFCLVVPERSFISRIITFSNIGDVAPVVQTVDDALSFLRAQS